MLNYWQVWGLLLSAAMKTQGAVRSILGLGSLLALVMLGIAQKQFSAVIESGFARVVIGVVLFFGFLFYVVSVVQAVINEHFKKSEESHYRVSREARREHAYRLIHLLLVEGKQKKTAGQIRHQEWDRRVTNTIGVCCGRGLLQRYLTATERNDSNQPLDERNYSKAVSMLYDFVEEDFRNSLE